MTLSGFRSIIEYSVYDGEHYHTVQICRPNSTEPSKDPKILQSQNDYLFYIFNRFPLDGFELTDVSFEQLAPFINYFKKANGRLKEIQHNYSQKRVPFDEFVDREHINLNGSKTPPKLYYPAYEPVISIVEVDPIEQDGISISAHDHVSQLERHRLTEYISMIKALGYDIKDKNIRNWITSNANVYRLENPAAEGKLDVGNMVYCEPGKHYWHFVGNNTKFIRKFYVDKEEIKSHSLKEQIDSIPKETCPDALEHRVEREGRRLTI